MKSKDRIYDIIIFGATGFTGQFILEEVGKLYQEGSIGKYAVAGRNRGKLESALEMANRNTNLDFSGIDIIEADANDFDSLIAMAKQGKIVINCVGPYRFFGIETVNACLESGADHIDISGEPEYLERVQLQFSDVAEDRKVFVIGSCGFDSVPADIGTLWMLENFGGDINSLDMVVGFHDNSKGNISVNVTTLECALYGYSNRKSLGSIRKELFKDKLPKATFNYHPKGSVWYSNEANRWCVPNMASDRSVVMRTQYTNYHSGKQRPFHFNAYFGMRSLVTAMGSVIFGLLFMAMAFSDFTRNLLLKFPSFFSFGGFTREGPNRKDLQDLKFRIAFIGKGWDSSLKSPNEQHSHPPNITKVAEVTGPDPGYFGTAIIVTQCALTLLKERDRIQYKGGVLTPGLAFCKTSLVERLERKGINFSMVSK